MSSVSASNQDKKEDSVVVSRIAVYGTLRDDDNSGAAWTKEFVADASAYSAIVSSFIMMLEEQTAWPFAFPSNSRHDCIVIRLLHWSDPQTFQQKLKLADSIEDFDPSAPPLTPSALASILVDNSQRIPYQRSVVTAQVGMDRIPAFMYHCPAELLPHISKAKNWKRLESGDWLQRPRPRLLK